MSRGGHGDDSGVIGCLVWMFLIVLALPFAGIYLLGKNDDDAKVLGVVLLVVGIILYGWIAFAG